MPRRGTITRREVLPDPVYNSKLVTQVINKVLLDGKKSTAEQIVYGALEIVREKAGRDPVEVLQDSIQALTPHLEVRSRRVGGATYQVPVEVRGPRANTLAIRWAIGYSRQRREKTMAERLANELLDAFPFPRVGAGEGAVERFEASVRSPRQVGRRVLA
jgi:small subunit ribosomal protein S7